MSFADIRSTEIRDLEQVYAERVNLAVAEDRYDLVDRLAADFDAAVERLSHAA